MSEGEPNDNGSGSTDDQPNPNDRLIELTEQAEDDLRQVQRICDSAPQITGEQDKVIDKWATDVAALEQEAGERFSTAQSYAETLKDTAVSHTKQQVLDALEAARDDHPLADTGEKKPLNVWLEDRVEKVTVKRTTDHRDVADWTWHIRGSRNFTTSATKDGIPHWNPDVLRVKIHTRTGDDPAPPEEDLADRAVWRDWINEFIEQHGESYTQDGPRTAVAEALMSFIERTDAYTDLADAVDGRSALALDEDDGELLVPREHIERLCDAEEVTSRGLQVEFESRGWLAMGGQASRLERVRVGDESRQVRVWVLDLDAIPSEPASIIEDPKTPAEKAEEDQQVDDEEDDADGDAEEQAGGMIDRLDLGDPAIDDTDSDESDDTAVEDVDTADVDPDDELGEITSAVRDYALTVDDPTVAEAVDRYGLTTDAEAAAVAAIIEEVIDGDEAGDQA